MIDQIDVFISYKLDERALAETVMRSLRDAGYVAVTNFNIAKSQEFGDAIDKMIRSARLTLALWTTKSVASDWVRKEASLALDLEKAGKPNLYLGVLIDDVTLELPVYLRGLQMVDLTRSGITPEGLRHIIASVQERLGRPRNHSSETVEVASSRAMDEFQLYEYARSLDIASAYEHFLTIYPDGKFASDARRELAAARKWYMHPLRRSNLMTTLTAAGVVIAGLGVFWSSSQGEGFVSGKSYIEVVTERDILKAAKVDAEARITELSAQWRSASAARDKAQQELQSALSQLQEDKAGVADTAAKDEMIRVAEARIKELETRLDLAEAALAVANRVSPSSADISGQRTGASECEDSGNPGVKIANICVDQTATALSLGSTPLDSSDRLKIARLSNLEELSLVNSLFIDLDFVSSLRNLKTLRINATPVRDLTPLASLAKLTHLDISGTQIMEITALSSLTNLEELQLAQTAVEDLSPLQHLPKLKVLNISGTLVKDLLPLSQSTKLTALLAAETEIDDLDPIRMNDQLGLLDLSGTLVRDLSSLRGFRSLHWLSLPDGRVAKTSDEVLAVLE